MRKALLVAWLLLSGFPLMAKEGLMTRFFPPPARVPQAPVLTLPIIPPIQNGPKVSVDEHNRGVRLNNEGKDLLDGGHVQEALARFSEACAADPNEAAFVNNLMVAMQKGKSKPEDIVRIGRKLMAMVPGDAHIPLIIGQVILNKMNKPLEAIPYLELARQKNARSEGLLQVMAQAYEKAGFPDQAIEFLQRAVQAKDQDPYPGYLLGKLLMDKGDLQAAIRALKETLPRDNEGFVHDMYLRARYYAGQLDGLAPLCQQALQRFPEIINRKSLERIYQSLIPRRVKFQETITVLVEDPSSMKKLGFLVSLPPNFAGQQMVVLESSECFSEQSRAAIQPEAVDAKGRTRFTCPPDCLGKKISLRLTYDIHTFPCLLQTGRWGKQGTPDLQAAAGNEKLNLDNPDLTAIFNRLAGMEGDWVQNAFKAVSKGLTYSENFKNYPVSWALAHPNQCDCTEFSLLLTALCVKRGIPARVTTGFLLKPELEGKDGEIGHAWTEIYHPDKGWVAYDPTLGANLQLAYFGNKLSDQILFKSSDTDSEARTAIDYTSGSPLMEVKISNSFKFETVPDR